jgi:hypothetical protein
VSLGFFDMVLVYYEHGFLGDENKVTYLCLGGSERFHVGPQMNFLLLSHVIIYFNPFLPVSRLCLITFNHSYSYLHALENPHSEDVFLF